MDNKPTFMGRGTNNITGSFSYKVDPMLPRALLPVESHILRTRALTAQASTFKDARALGAVVFLELGNTVLCTNNNECTREYKWSK